MFTISKLIGCKPKPYQNPIKVKICAIGIPETYTTAAGQKKMSTVLGLADKENTIKAVLYDQDKLEHLRLMDTVMIMNYVLKSDQEPIIVLTKVTKIMKTSNIDVPADIARKAHLIGNPPPASMVTLKDAKTSPAKTMISVKGRVTSEEMVRTVQVKGQDVSVQTIKIKDETADIKVSLWREKTETCAVGNFLQFTNVVVNHYQEEISLSTTCKTQIQQCEAPPSLTTGKVVAYEKTEMGFFLMVEEGENFHNFDIPLAFLSVALECEENTVEETIEATIPFDCEVKTVNGNVEAFIKN